MKNLLLLDDDPKQRQEFLQLCKSAPFQVQTAATMDQAREIIHLQHIHVFVCDLHLVAGQGPEVGIQFIKYVTTSYPDIKVLAISSDTDLDTWLKAREVGALFYLRKPIYSRDEILLAVQFAQQLSEYNRQELAAQEAVDGLLLDEGFRHLAQGLAKNRSVACVVSGESGTGKEEFARLVHHHRQRAEGPLPFVALHCGQVKADLHQALMFGVKQGAGTAQERSSDGLVAEANEGILFLDEIQLLPSSCQQELFQVLDSGSYRRVGDTVVMQTDFQVIATTTMPLATAVKNGTFLQALKVRLRGVELELPPFRARSAQWPEFLRMACQDHQVLLGLGEADEILASMASYDWPGNIREFLKLVPAVKLLAGVWRQGFAASFARVLSQQQASS